MSTPRILVRAPSNIALVKYMGKRDASANLPENASLSMTLSRLCTFVEIRFGEKKGEENGPRWIAEVPEGARGESPRLDAAGIEKFLRHYTRVLTRGPEILTAFGLSARADASQTPVEIRTANTFPHAAGIASSASSFAGLTLAAFTFLAADRESFRRKYLADAVFRVALANLSREGSGSSCRSFDGPFVSWEGESVAALPSNLPALSDLVVVVAAGEKKVGSSEAHRRVKSSPAWAGRVARATDRYADLRQAIRNGDFPIFSAVADDDSRDMHELFETSVPPFSYFQPGTRSVLKFVESLRAGGKIDAAITMDAGPNVHVLVPQNQEEFLRKELITRFPEYPVLVDRQGAGAEILAIEEAAAAVPVSALASRWISYSTDVPGKWVLSGEHTVLRGGRAIALPHPTFALKLDFRPHARNLEVHPDMGALVVQDLLRIAREWLGKRGVKMDLPRGSVRIQGTIPFSAGLGSSAALSVAIARWVLSAHSLDRALERELAREMENHFHGQSSGMDIAAVSIGEPILFSMKDGAVGLGLRNLPEFAFFDSGLRASTKDCIEKVVAVRTADPQKGEALDREMGQATVEILEGLRTYDDAIDRGDVSIAEGALAKVATGMDRSLRVFSAWDLVPEEMHESLEKIRQDGFLAPRITGAGGGGFVVAIKKTDR